MEAARSDGKELFMSCIRIARFAKILYLDELSVVLS
jgi:hypothetical protein